MSSLYLLVLRSTVRVAAYAGELADARVAAIVYACLVAVMARGPGEHERVEQQLGEAARRAGASP